MMRNKVVSIVAMAGVSALALSLAACSSDSSEGGTDTKVFKVAFNQTESHPQYKALEALGDRLKERTDGRYDLEVFPNETLGSQKDTIELVQAGSIDFSMVSGSLLENFNPDFVVFNLPYVFDSKEHQSAVVNDPEITADLFSSIEDKGISVLAGFHGGIRNVYNSEKPINTPADLAGMKIRVIESDTNLRMMELMGGSGTPMGQGEVYTAIQSGVLSGAENNESIYANLKHAEIAPYYSYTRHLMFPDYLIVNPKTMDALSAEDQKIFSEELAAALVEEGDFWADEVKTSIATAEAAGAKFNEVDADAFRDALAPLVEEKLTTQVSKDLYAKVRAAAE
ncbi:tripartite ATP-independent transporter solute receptor, DctP family [Sanguibacter gelidistatuariae]|uniref:Tripartite ATP-independent transporter solute receptor, DctP family n=1 Tax=Sanguibacter gelidistatuariae TaxID=1814289 RepID=A0A1G6V0M9_9MICO|nr:TRAP transporter substrate-binding protein [Sanguibacter gelidistatuariae]SDD47088.1 tripartite ATP-independent transporter solute receptor, DctP family [Sanguibacter gelidistatuariae]